MCIIFLLHWWSNRTMLNNSLPYLGRFYMGGAWGLGAAILTTCFHCAALKRGWGEVEVNSWYPSPHFTTNSLFLYYNQITYWFYVNLIYDLCAPKAEVTGSNPVECTILFNALAAYAQSLKSSLLQWCSTEDSYGIFTKAQWPMGSPCEACWPTHPNQNIHVKERRHSMG